MSSLKQFLKGFKNGIKHFGNNIAVIINSILLCLVYVIGVGITSFFAKIFRKRFLDMSLKSDENRDYENKDNDTYWKDLNLEKKSIEKYYRQF